VGGEGADLLVGGKHRDQFVFRTLEDRGDRIQDFTRQDVIVLVEIFKADVYGGNNPIDDYLQIRQLGSSTVIRIDPDGDAGSNPFKVLTTLKNTNASLLTNDNFIV
jgi:Ca2+-binding RTX toxin-like protein